MSAYGNRGIDVIVYNSDGRAMDITSSYFNDLGQLIVRLW